MRYVAVDKWQRRYRVPGATDLNEAQRRASEALGPFGYLQVEAVPAGTALPTAQLDEE